jgi:hypothetical protein
VSSPFTRLSDAVQPIGGLEGSLKASLTGDELRRLANRPEMEAIAKDSEQHML